MRGGRARGNGMGVERAPPARHHLAMALPWWLPFGSVPRISAVQLAKDLAGIEAPQLVDVRTRVEYQRGHLRGAISAPIQTLGQRLGDLGLDPSRRVVAICLTAHRSIPAVRLLRARGLDAAELAGGMLAWRAAGFPEEVG
jgi:rhodanese-related sulfurtransferase